MYTRRWLVCGIVCAVLAGAQESPESIQVTGTVKQAVTITPQDLAKMPRASVRTKSNGTETVYEGVWVREVLNKAGVPAGKELRGKALASYVIAEADDGYRVLFSLAELDPAVSDNQFLIADTAGGKPLSGKEGGSGWCLPRTSPGCDLSGC